MGRRSPTDIARAGGRVVAILGVCLAAIAGSPASPRAEPQQPLFGSGVQLVTIDAVVLDHDGLAVTGLTRGDFQVSENGEPQAITFFEPVNTAAGAAAPTATGFSTSSNEGPPPAAARSFVIVYDDLHIAPQKAPAARAGVVAFLQHGVRDSDRVALVVAGSGAWWSAGIPEGREDLLAFLDGQASARSTAPADGLTDTEAERIAEHDDVGALDLVVERWVRQGRCEDVCAYVAHCDPRDGRRACADQVSAEALQRHRGAQHGAGRTLETIAGALAGLASDRGRKSVVLVSQGFLLDPALPAYRRVVQAALRANAAVYFLDVRGLQATSEVNDVSHRGDYDDWLKVASEESQLGAAGAEQVAEDSGGFAIRRDNDPAAGLARVARESEAYYLLGYEPSLRPGHAGFRKLTVRASRPGTQVRARKGYFVDDAGRIATETEAGAADARAAQARRQPPAKSLPRSQALGPALTQRRDLRLQAASYAGPPAAAGRTKLHLVAEIDLTSLGTAGETAKHQLPLELRLDVWPRDGKEWVAFDRKLKLEAGGSAGAPRWQAVPFDMALAPGIYQARLRLRDVAAGREGTLTHRFEVPAPRGLRFATPVLGDALHGDGAAAALAPTTARVFRRGPNRFLYVQFEVLGAAPARRGERAVNAQVTLRDALGRTVRAVPSAAVEPDGAGRLARVLGFTLDDLAPGRYDLVLEARDERTAQTCVHREGLELRAP